MSSFPPSHTVLSNSVKRVGICSVWPYYYSPNDLLGGWEQPLKTLLPHRAVVHRASSRRGQKTQASLAMTKIFKGKPYPKNLKCWTNTTFLKESFLTWETYTISSSSHLELRSPFLKKDHGCPFSTGLKKRAWEKALSAFFHICLLFLILSSCLHLHFLFELWVRRTYISWQNKKLSLPKHSGNRGCPQPKTHLSQL